MILESQATLGLEARPLQAVGKSLSCPQAHPVCCLSCALLSFPPHSGAPSGSHTSVSLCRESKELADLARLHPTSCAPNGLNPNLMVTGGPTLAGSGRWSADPATHLAAHPWLPRSGSTSMWLAGHPYGECSSKGYLSLREGWDQLNISQLPSRGGTDACAQSACTLQCSSGILSGDQGLQCCQWAWNLLTLM